MGTTIQKASTGTAIQKTVNELVAGERVKAKFREVLGKKAPQFLTSLVNVVNGNKLLKEAEPGSVLAAALVAATYDLPIDSNLGFSAIVPYNSSTYDPKTRQYERHQQAQFQLMYKGFVQLAIRSGEYESMNYACVYEDEIVGYNPITGEVKFVDDFTETRQRENGEDDKIVGYYAWFRLKKGFSHYLYMTKAEVENHAKRYSQSYRNDLDKGRKSSRWSTDFKSMALKTVIKQLLSKWGPLSIEMQRAIGDDQKVFNSDESWSYLDNPEDAKQQEAIDVFATDSEPQAMPEAQPEPVQQTQDQAKPAQQPTTATQKGKSATAKTAAKPVQDKPEVKQGQDGQMEFTDGRSFDDIANQYQAALPWD